VTSRSEGYEFSRFSKLKSKLRLGSKAIMRIKVFTRQLEVGVQMGIVSLSKTFEEPISFTAKALNG